MIYNGNSKGHMMAKKKSTWKDKLAIKDITDSIAAVSSEYTSYVDRVNSYRTTMEADYTLPDIKGRSKVRPKTIKKLHNYSYAALSEGLLSDYDIVDVTPRGNADEDKASANKLLLNYQLNEEMDFHAVVDKASRYFEDYGSFYLKLAWNYKERKVKSRKTPTLFKELPDTTTEEQFKALQEKGMITPEGLLKVDNVITKVVDDHPVILLKKYNQIVLGPSKDGSNDIQSLEFIADKYYSTIADLKSTGKYNDLDKVSKRSTSYDTDISAIPDADFETEFNDMLEDNSELSSEQRIGDNQPLVVTEYWTKVLINKNITPVVTTFVAGVIISQEVSPLGIDVGYPFTRGIYSPSLEDELYDGIPDTLDLDEEQRVIGAVTRGLIDIMGKSANGQIGMAHGLLDPAEERKRQQGLDYKFNPALDPTRGIIQEKFPELPQSGLQMLTMMENSMESASGKKLFGQGLGGDSYGNVAAGIKATTDATTQRMMSTIRNFNKPFVEIIKMMAELNKEFITDDKIIALSDGSFSTINNEKLQADISISISVTTPELDDRKANDLGFLVQTLGDSVDHNTKNILLADIARLKKRPDLAQAILDVPEPQPSQEELELHQLQVELLKAQIANEYAKAKENDSDGELNLAKVATEEAKAGVLYSTKDNQDLEFIHKRNGTDHKRNVEAMDAEHVNAMEKEAFNVALNHSQGVINNDVKTNKVPKKKNDAEIPVIDLPQESLQPSDLI